MSTSPTDSFDLETTIADIRSALGDGQVTAEALVDRYLAELGEAAPYDSLAAVYETGDVAEAVASRIEAGDILDVDAGDEHVDYLRRLRRREQLTDTVLAGFADRELDAILYPPSTISPVERPENQPFAELNCELSAHTGLPALVVPAGFTDDGRPVGVELLGRRFAEPRLFELASSFERTFEHRRPPDSTN